MQKLQNLLLETEKTRKTQQKKQTFGRPSQQIGIVSRGHTSSQYTAAAK